MPRANDIIPYYEMCQREGTSLQRGMNFHLHGKHSVILMSVRFNAPYADRVEEEGRVLIYEGHNENKTALCKYPELVDQPEFTKTGKPKPQLTLLANSIREVIADAIDAGGSSLRDHIQADGTLGYFQHFFRAYDREGRECLTDGCGGTVERIVQSGRSTFYCRACQK